MARCAKLLSKARRNPAGLTFQEACGLAECFGFHHVRTRGSHHVFKKDGEVGLLNLQARGGRAVAYQVRQLLDLIDENSRGG